MLESGSVGRYNVRQNEVADVPAVIFKDDQEWEKAYPVMDTFLDTVRRPIHVVRNPRAPEDERPWHLISQDALPGFLRLLDEAGVAYELVDSERHPEEDTEATVAGRERR